MAPALGAALLIAIALWPGLVRAHDHQLHEVDLVAEALGCFLLEGESVPVAGGTVDASPLPNCAGVAYKPQSLVQVTANETPGWTFLHWTGDLCNTTNPTLVTMDAHQSLTAHFAQEWRDLTLSTSLNLVAANVEVVSPTLVADGLEEILCQGGDVPTAYRWRSETDTWEGHQRDLPFANFPLELGQGYLLQSAADSTWQRAGSRPDAPVSVQLNPI